jgi:hypothetical protein
MPIVMGRRSDFDAGTAGRVRRTVAAFREANQRLYETAVQLGLTDQLVPAICECANPACRDVVLLRLEQFREVLAPPRRFINLPGHQAVVVGVFRVVSEEAGYVVVQARGVLEECAQA